MRASTSGLAQHARFPNPKMPQTHDILPWQFFNFELVRVLAMAPTQGADVGECLEAASKIKKNDPESWFQAWAEAATFAEEAADTALKVGDSEAARWAFLRACNYRRASE